MSTDIRTPNARAADPEPSHIAGERVTREGKRQRRIRLLCEAVDAEPGLTAVELAQRTGIDRHEASRRLSDAWGVKLSKGPRRPCTVKGSVQTTWWPKKNGEG